MRTSRAVATGLAALVLAVGPLPAGAADGPRVIAHRGGAGLWAENTLGAFRNAHALFGRAGVPGWIELDTQSTSDGVLVVIHDATLDRTTDCEGPVVEQPASAVTSCDADPDPLVVDPVPTLAEVLGEGALAGWRLVIEIKDIPGEPGFDVDCAELADALTAAVASSGFAEQNLIVQSFWPPCLDRLEATAPAIETLLLTSSSTIGDLAGVPTPVPIGFTLTENVLFSTVRGYEHSAPDHQAPDLVGPVVTAAHLLGRSVVVWTVDDADRMRELAAIGVDGIISDRPDVLLETLYP